MFTNTFPQLEVLMMDVKKEVRDVFILMRYLP